MKTRRTGRVVGTLVAGGALVAAAVSAAAPAQADTAWNINQKVYATTTTAKTGQVITFPVGTFTAVLANETVTGTIKLPNATSTMKLGPLPLAKVTMQVIPHGQAVAHSKIDGTVWHMTATQVLDIRIVSIKTVGLLPIELVSGACTTSTPITQVTKGDIDWGNFYGVGGPFDYTLTGSYTIPNFKDCGLNTLLINSIVAGPNNKISLHFKG